MVSWDTGDSEAEQRDVLLNHSFKILIGVENQKKEEEVRGRRDEKDEKRRAKRG